AKVKLLSNFFGYFNCNAIHRSLFYSLAGTARLLKRFFDSNINDAKAYMPAVQQLNLISPKTTLLQNNGISSIQL
ncbi:MAG TPA: hypothetical protein V6D03_12585, partial [Candidatus Caenarcaniphilales bacterium]